MIIYLAGGSVLFIFGIYIGIKINKWSQKINAEIAERNNIKLTNKIFQEILENLENKKTKFKTRVNQHVHVTTKLTDIGKVEIVYSMDKSELSIYQNQYCILTSEVVEKQVVDKIITTINEVHRDKINDVVDLFGLIFSRESFEKTFRVNIDDIVKKTTDLIKDEQTDVGKIIEINSRKMDIDEILDKINRVGIENLTPEERKFLDDYNR